MWNSKIGHSELTSKSLLLRIIIFAVVYGVVETAYLYAGRGAASSSVAGLLFATALGYIFLQVPFRSSARLAS